MSDHLILYNYIYKILLAYLAAWEERENKMKGEKEKEREKVSVENFRAIISSVTNQEREKNNNNQ